MSSIKSLFEVYAAKPKDEQDFVNKHIVIKHKDANGNGDDVFNGNVKKVDRKKTRLGYDAPEDEKVYEEAELDESLGMGYKPTSEKSKFDDGHRAKLLNPDGRISYLSQKSYKTADHAKAAAKFYHSIGSLPDRTIDSKMHQYNKDYDAKHEKNESFELDQDQIIDAILEMAELEGVELTDEQVFDIFEQVSEGFDPSSEDIAKMLVKKHGKNVTKAHIDAIDRDSRGSLDHEEIMQHVKKLTEGYVNLAQQRAVWATRNDGGKGHPDNKKKKTMKEDKDAKWHVVRSGRILGTYKSKDIADAKAVKHPLNKVRIAEAVEQDDTVEKNEMAQTQLHFIGYAVKEILDYIKMGGDVEEWYQNKLSKVHSDIESLHSYVEGEKRRSGMVKEDADEQIDEILKASTPMKTWIKDFQKSDAPQFKGKSPEKRRQMAIAAKLSTEEVELDEGLMHNRYMRSHGKKARGTGSWAFTTKEYGSPKEKDMHFTSGQKTLSDAHKEAAAKLGTKNLYVMEEVEQIEEAINFTAYDAIAKGHDGKSYNDIFNAHGSSIHNKIKAVRAERDNQPGKTSHATFLHDKMLKAYASWYKNEKAVKEESEVPFEGPYKKTGTVRKDEYGNVIQNVPRHLAKQAMKSLKKEDVINRAIDKYLPEEVKYTLEERFAIKIQNVPETHHDALIELFSGLSESNQKTMLLQLSEDDGVSKLLDFAIKNRKA